MTREFDVVVYGASGFTGKLVAEHIAHLGKTAPPLRWALAGRNAEKLAAVRAASGAPDDTTLLHAESHDAAALADLARRARVVLTTVGPYQLYGSPLVAACAAAGTDYVDLCGEPVWMRKMIDAHDSEAKTSGARIVLSCGFDSIPFDLGVAYLQSEATKRFGAPCPRVKGRVRKMKGTFSGGTAESFRATMAAAAKDPNVLALLRDPFALTPGAPGPKQPSGNKPEYDGELGSWAAPFVMAAINTRNVHRSNLLRGYPYGRDFLYDEMILTGPGEKGEKIAQSIAAEMSGMASDKGPKPGEGPSKEERDTGFYDLLFVGTAADGRRIEVAVKGDRDPGYGSTSKMITESALGLIEDSAGVPGGVTTPAAAFGVKFTERLARRAGVTFAVERA